MKSLVIVESPAKAKKIQEYLGKNYIVLATQGHIADLAKGGKHGIGVDIDNGFRPRYAIMADKLKVVDSLIAASEGCDQVLIASDPDREGEAIAWHVASRLDGCNKPLKRVEFHEITKKGIQKGISKPREIDQNLFHAQEARRILDRIVGFMVSPFLMTSFGPKLSAGRVQSVVTRMIIDREAEIESFVPQEYWSIRAHLSNHANENFWAKYDVKVTDKNTAMSVKQDLLDKNSFYEVIAVESNLEKKKQPPPMITSELQRIMSRSFGFSPERTMKAAQSLYENGYVTYIRTDSVRIEDEALKNLRSYLSSNGYSVPSAPISHKSKSDAQDAHECIRPTDLMLGCNNYELIGDESKVYEIIWKYFVASQMEPAVYDTLKVTIRHSKDKTHVLKASGKVLKSNGFLEIMGVSNEEKIDIPSLSKGDRLSLVSDAGIVCERKMTQPPPRFSADTLIKAMEQRNIGRPATYAEVLSKIATRNYVHLDGKYFKPTELGRQINGCLEKFFSFMGYDYTMNMEKKLDDVALGSVDKNQMLKEFFSSFESELVSAYSGSGARLCESCQSPMVKKTSKDGKNSFLGCSKFPKCRSIIPLEQNKE